MRRSGSALGAVDHLHHAPGARQLYAAAERRLFDPYVVALRLIDGFARAAMRVDRAVDFVVDVAASRVALRSAAAVRALHTGGLARYLAWSLAGTAAVVVYLLGGF